MVCPSEKFQNRFLFFVDFENEYNSGRDQTNVIGLNSRFLGPAALLPETAPVIEYSKTIRFELNS